MTIYVVTGASGQLGHHVLERLLEKVPASDVVALARDPAKLADYAAKGVEVRTADYDAPETLAASLVAIGFPEYAARVIANSAYSTSLGALEEGCGTLGKLIGRPTTPISDTIKDALA